MTLTFSLSKRNSPWAAQQIYFNSRKRIAYEGSSLCGSQRHLPQHWYWQNSGNYSVVSYHHWATLIFGLYVIVEAICFEICFIFWSNATPIALCWVVSTRHARFASVTWPNSVSTMHWSVDTTIRMYMYELGVSSLKNDCFCLGNTYSNQGCYNTLMNVKVN